MLQTIKNYYNKSNTIIRFIGVGLINTIIGISSIFLLLNVFGFSYWVSTFIGNGIGAIISYFLNRNFTFNSNVNNKKGIALFLFVILVSYYVSYNIGYSLINKNVLSTNIYGEELSILLAALIYTVLNYLGQRYLTFKQV
ncbi:MULTISPECIES: GtrA family protein [Bacillaceae]|uniref:GtrA family protein n=1 Tax=Bacillaceae TaxID=186817 RepID=UPI000BFC744A|nr:MULTISPECIES: GtrA family protein [Bacillaceae]PGT75825.1 polysaccharide biosynthesis protein GtrA [Bacillus sp. AFS040349]UGB31260.1 GtrA family protein [Metabacillus sp. B2-18]